MDNTKENEEIIIKLEELLNKIDPENKVFDKTKKLILKTNESDKDEQKPKN